MVTPDHPIRSRLREFQRMHFCLFLGLLRLWAGFFQTPPDTSDLVQSIEQQRGGRHWVDQKTDPPKSPEESQACFQIEPGYAIQLVAAEPVVLDPVAIDFDKHGRMFVAEYGDYPVGPADPAAPALSQIVLLNDSDGDGRMDQRQIFASQLRFCHSLLCLMDGVLACTETEILFLKDTNADGEADVREVWFDGFEPAHPQMQIGCPRWGHDNWIYLTYGPGKVRCRRPGFESSEPVVLSHLDFRFDPKTMQFESVTGLGQFGNTIDNDGHRFFSTNRNPIMTDVLPRSALSRNPFYSVPAGHTDVGPGGEQTRVFPLVAMKSNWLSHAGTHTSACGVTAYRGDLFGPEGSNSVFACEPVGHLVTRNLIQPDGATVTSTRARPDRDFLASTDTWFRPASLANGPDGALYLADMYRLWVEHPKFVPEDVAAKMDWRAGEDRGRIWRIVPASAGPLNLRSLPPLQSTSDLISLLKDSNGWRRLLGQRLIVERGLFDVVPELEKLAADATVSPWSRMHALWCLHGLDSLTPQILVPATRDSSALVRRHAVRITGDLLNRYALQRNLQQVHQVQHFLMMTDSVLARLLDEDPSVQLEALLIPVIQSDSRFGSFAAKIMVDRASDRWLRAAVLTACAECSGEILRIAVPQWHSESATQTSATQISATQTSAVPGADQRLADRSELIRQLASIVAIRGNLAEVQSVVQLFRSSDKTPQWWQTALLIGLAQGLPSTRNADIPKSLSALLQSPPAGFDPEGVAALQKLMTSAVQVSLDRQLPELTRVAAIRLLPFQSADVMDSAVVELLGPDQPLSCQLAAMEGVRQTGRQTSPSPCSTNGILSAHRFAHRCSTSC